MFMSGELDQTRKEIRLTFAKWNIGPANYTIEWEDRGIEGRNCRYPYGVRVRYFRKGIWQEVSCMDYGGKNDNLRQCLFLIDRLRIAEKHGVQYQGLTYTKEVLATSPVDTEKVRREDLLDAYDILGGSPDDPIDLIKELYRRKSLFYHPDHGGDGEKFKRLTKAYQLIMESRGQK